MANEETTSLKVLFDDNFLYFAFSIIDRHQVSKYFSPANDHGSYLFKKDDLIELFIDPNGDGKTILS